MLNVRCHIDQPPTVASLCCSDRAAIEEVNAAINSGDPDRLLKALLSGDARLSGIKEENIK